MELNCVGVWPSRSKIRHPWSIVTLNVVQLNFKPFLSGTKGVGLIGREAEDHFQDRRGTEEGDHHGENESEAFEYHPD